MANQISNREKEVLDLISKGQSAKMIAQELYLSLHTVRDYIKSVKLKLSAQTLPHAVRLAMQSGLLMVVFTSSVASQIVIRDTVYIPCGYSIRVLDGCGDIDGDGVCIQSDNCPSIANANQLDIDFDTIGDVCDDDRDGDGVDNNIDCDPDSNTIAYTDNSPCSDSDPCTVNDFVTNCVCTGTALPDFDNDGTCDAFDPDDDDDGVDDSIDCDQFDAVVNYGIGDSCDDGNSSTYDDSVDGSCLCAGEVDYVRDSIGSFEAQWIALGDSSAMRVSESTFNSIYGHDSLFSVVTRIDTIPGSKTEGVNINRAPNLGLAQFWDNPNNNTNVTASSGHKYDDIQANDQLVLFWIRSSAAVSGAKVKVGSSSLDDFVDIVTVDLIQGNNWFVCKKCPPIPYDDPRMAVYYPSPANFYVFNSSNVNAMSIQGATGDASILSYTGVSQTTFPETEPRYYHDPSQYIVTVNRP